jgi:hypothetical protein
MSDTFSLIKVVPLRIALSVILAIGLVGCTTPPFWKKPGASEQDFDADRNICDRDAGRNGHFGIGLLGAQNRRDFIDRCLVDHGWIMQLPFPGSSNSNWRDIDHCPTLTGFTLIKAVAADPGTVCAAFENLATKMLRRDRYNKVTALQRVVGENPGRQAAIAHP